MHNRDAGDAPVVRPHDRHPPRMLADHDADGFRPTLPGNGRSALWARVAWLEGVVSPLGVSEPNPGVVRGGGERPSGTGSPDGGAFRASGGDGPACGLRFDVDVAPGGYAWWYVDAISDDGRYAITLIAFLGSVFSPYYAWARHRGRGDPLDHAALNVALYGVDGKLWAMTERGRRAVTRSADKLSIGRSGVEWDGSTLTFHIDELAVPRLRRIRGTVRVRPVAFTGLEIALDANGRHRWSPIAPISRVEVTLDRPNVRWSGNGYLDTNMGAEALENAFAQWHWSRAVVDGETAVLYDVTDRAGGHHPIALRFDSSGRAQTVEPPPPMRLPRTLWRIDRRTRTDAGSEPAVMQTLEDSPFYARSLVSGRLLGAPFEAVHESLSLDRFRTTLVKAALPFRMPRALF